MIPRYEEKEISHIWSDQFKFERFLEIELAILEALEKEKMVPRGTTIKIKLKSKVDPKRIREIEEKTKHDIIAFTTSISEQLPREVGRYFHYGVTSSDVIDSALTLQLRASLDYIIPALFEVRKSLLMIAKKHLNTPTIGRSHGMHAEPMSLGQKFLGFYAEFSRRYSDLVHFYQNELTIQVSGSIGNYAIISPKVEEIVAKKFKLKVEPHSTQVIPRDHIAKLLSIHALIATAIERLAVEIRHLHRSEVYEVIEGFVKGQKGSSTMPHKKNPIASENLTGLARVIRSHAHIAMENSVLWHERDISHSSAERMILPDNLGLMLYSLNRLNGMLNNLHFQKETILKRVLENHTYLSSLYLHLLINQTGKDFSREMLYELVQNAAFESKTPEDFKVSLEKALHNLGAKVTLPLLNPESIKDIYLKECHKIYTRVTKEYPLK